MSKRSWAVAMVLAAGLTTTVEAAPAGFTAAGETAHLTFYSRGNVTVVAKGTEKRLQRIAQLLGQLVVSRADCYRYERAEDVAAVTGQYAGGVTYPALHQVHSTEASLDHELVHLVAAELGDPGSFFQEGLAVALGDRGRLGGRKADDPGAAAGPARLAPCTAGAVRPPRTTWSTTRWPVPSWPG